MQVLPCRQKDNTLQIRGPVDLDLIFNLYGYVPIFVNMQLLISIFDEHFRLEGDLLQVGEGEGHNQVERPVEPGGDAHSAGSEPERVDLSNVFWITEWKRKFYKYK